MAHTNSTSSNDVSATYHMFRDHPLLYATGPHQNTPFLHPNVHNFSMCASPYQHAPHFHVTASPPCTLDPFQGEGRDTHMSSHNRDLRCTSSSLNQRHVANTVHQNSNYENMLPHMPPDAGAMCTYASPEALLDVISGAQKKLQQLQAIVELTVQVGGQAQRQQSLAAGVKSIMSQLFAGLQQQEAPCLNQIPGSSSQLNEAIDLRFDGFHSNGMNNSMGSSHDGFFPSSSSCPVSMGPELTSSAMDLCRIRGMDVSKPSASMGPASTNSAMELVRMRGAAAKKPPGVMDLQLKEQGLSPLGDPVIHGAHSRTSNKLVEIDNESLSIAVEARDSHVADSNGNEEAFFLEDHDYPGVLRDDDDDGEVENLPPGSYELVEMAAAEILAEHTHFCEMCGKGFKRDANLRMHMRGHGDEYKTPAALARPNKSSHNPSMVNLRRYSCPYVGCKRNKQHRKFLPLKTMLCVKNHYRRSHCPKLLTCSKCKTKKFSVVADLKTHEKHCGHDKWQCSCGTTFSRKDKLVGHIGLFAGHTPTVPLHETESLNGCGEPPFGCLSTEGGEGLEGPAPPGRGSALNTVGSNNGIDIPDLMILGKEGLMSDDNGRQRVVHREEKSFLAENSQQRGAMEVMQHCG